MGSGLETRDINNFTYLIPKIYLSSDRHMFLEKFNIDDDTDYILTLDFCFRWSYPESRQ